MNKSLQILIVDDNEQFVNRIISLIEDIRLKCDITTASGFDTAIVKLEESPKDIVLLDINMPGKNGIEVLRHIRHHFSGIEVVMLTNHTDPVYREQCTALGAGFFLDKSNDFMLVPDILRTYYMQLNKDTER